MREILQRSFKKSGETPICILACFVAVVLCAAFSPRNAAAESGEPVYKVVSPIGESTVRMTAMAPRMNTLAGKTVCMVWNHAFKSDVTLPAIGETLKKQYPGVKIVQYGDLPGASLPEPPGTLRKESAAMQAAFKEKGCDAVISGNGG